MNDASPFGGLQTLKEFAAHLPHTTNVGSTLKEDVEAKEQFGVFKGGSLQFHINTNSKRSDISPFEDLQTPRGLAAPIPYTTIIGSSK